MTEATPHPPRVSWHAAVSGSVVSRSRSLLWMFFLAVHLWLVYLNLFPAGYGLNDVTYVYRQWMEQGVYANYWPGISGVWVYPIAALVPMFVSTIFGFGVYGTTWLLMVTVLNGVALAALTSWGRPNSSLTLGWWWLSFVLLLGPIALGRIDSVTIPLALVAVMMIATRPGLAAVLLTVGTWTKIWPVAILAAMVIVLRERGRVVSGAILTSAVIVALALAFGSGSNVLSFITEQTGRGLQIEAPVTTFWMWQAFAGVPGVSVYYDTDILTYQVAGGAAATAASLMTPLLVVVVGALCLLGMLALRRGTSAAQILPTLALALVVALIAFNKVGSPQFMTWLSVPVVLGIATRMAGAGRSFRVPAGIVLVMALLTQLIYPYFYSGVVAVQPLMLTVLSVRNALLFVVLGWAVTELVGMARRPATSGTLANRPAEFVPAMPSPSAPVSSAPSTTSTTTVTSTPSSSTPSSSTPRE